MRITLAIALLLCCACRMTAPVVTPRPTPRPTPAPTPAPCLPAEAFTIVTVEGDTVMAAVQECADGEWRVQIYVPVVLEPAAP